MINIKKYHWITASIIAVMCVGLLKSSPTWASSLPVFGIDSSGNAVSVWNSGEGSSTLVMASTLPFGQNWSTPITISTETTWAFNPVLAVNESGDAVAIWTSVDTTTSTSSLYGAMLPSGGSWSSPVQITRTDETPTSYYKLSMNTTGDIVATWASYLNADPNTNIIRSATAIFGGTWSAPIQVGQ